MTMFRSQTDAMLAAKFDPQPYYDEQLQRRVTADFAVQYARPDEGPFRFDPRPEFIPPTAQTFRQGSRGDAPIRHMPRPRPNPILTNLRADVEMGTPLADAVGEYMAESDGAFENDWAADFTPDQIEHARKVLTRLVAWGSAES